VDEDAAITSERRYHEIAASYRALVPDHQINGLHIHVAVPSRDAAIQAMNRLRPWLPALLALSANSPFWDGRDTGFDSWRSIHFRRWTTSGAPPHFRDAAEYDARVGMLRGVGGTTDAGTLNWGARPSERFPTVEIRVCDAQLNADATVALAALVRGLVSSEHAAESAIPPELLDASLWHAARDGLSGDLVDPRTSLLSQAESVVEACVEAAAPGLELHGDAVEVASAVAEILSTGNGANRQRLAYRRGGLAGLASLLRRELEAS
jgi:carboxylate-amine ligase